MAVDEVLRVVFLQLPLKPLFRFKAVCKDWNSIIADPSFAAEYRDFSGGSDSLIYAGYFLYPTRESYSDAGIPIRFFGNGTVSEKELTSALDSHNTLHPEAERFVICSSNGILLCYSWETIERVQRIEFERKKLRRYYVCNPLTSEWKALPFPPVQAEAAIVGFVCLEPERGDSGSSYEYEVAQVLLYKYETRIQIYSSRSGKWLKSGQRRYFDFDFQRYSSVFIRGENNERGVFYWVDVHGNSFSYQYGFESDLLPARIGRDVGYSIGQTVDRKLVAYVADKDQFDVLVYRGADGYGKPHVWSYVQRVKFSADLREKFLTKTYLNQMPGDPSKVLFGAPGRLVCSFDLTSKKLEKLPHGYESCLGKMYNNYYCPYHLPSWYFRL